MRTLKEFFEGQKSETAIKSVGPVKWCNFCGGHHGMHEKCDLVPVQRLAKSGRVVQRMTRSEVKGDPRG